MTNEHSFGYDRVAPAKGRTSLRHLHNDVIGIQQALPFCVRTAFERLERAARRGNELAMKVTTTVEPMSQRMTVEFPYKHSTGEVIGRFLAGLKEQKKIWGRRVSKQGVVVPPLSFSEVDARSGGDWVEVKDEGTVTAVATVAQPIKGLHPVDEPFAFVLVKLEGADTALAHIVKNRLDEVRVGSRVKAVWATDAERTGTIRDIACFELRD